MMNILSKIRQWFKGTPYPNQAPTFLNRNREITTGAELYKLKPKDTDKE